MFFSHIHAELVVDCFLPSEHVEAYHESQNDASSDNPFDNQDLSSRFFCVDVAF